MVPIKRKHRLIQLAQIPALTVCCGAGPGSTTRASCVVPIATTTPLATGISISVFALPGLWNRQSQSHLYSTDPGPAAYSRRSLFTFLPSRSAVGNTLSPLRFFYVSRQPASIRACRIYREAIARYINYVCRRIYGKNGAHFQGRCAIYLYDISETHANQDF